VSSLQDGIAVSREGRPGGSFALLCLDRTTGADLPAVRAGLSRLWSSCAGLQDGVLPNLSEPVDPEGLAVLVGFGPKLLVDTADGAPAELVATRFPAPGGRGRPVLPGATLRWAGEVRRNPADCDVVVQLTAASEAAVSRALVEVCRSVRQDGALCPTAVYPGFRRRDRRGWIGFHDGVSNPELSDRLDLLRVPDGSTPAWLRGGTYLAFLRVGVRLERWDAIEPAQQELVVGRHRETGAPLEVDPAAPDGYRPAHLPAPGDVFAAGNEEARDPRPVCADEPSGLGQSHVHRARRHLTERILRQGYDYLEPVAGPEVLRTGLNFVSFQSSPTRLARILTGPGWFGRSPFGGPDGEFTDLLEVYAAGMFALPPRAPAASAPAGCPGLDAIEPAVGAG